MGMFIRRKSWLFLSLLVLAVNVTGTGPAVLAFDAPWDSGHNTTNLPPNPPHEPPKDPCEESTGSPVYLRTGNLILGYTDLSIPGRAIPMEIYRTYNCQERYNGPIGFGWVTSYTHQLIEVVKNNTIAQVIIRRDLGKRLTFNRNQDGSFTPANEDSYDVLVDNGDGTYTLNPIGQSRQFGYQYNFNTAGFLSSIIDSNGNSLAFTYDASNRLTGVADNFGRYFSYAYGNNSKVSTITDSSGRRISYSYDFEDNLISITNPLGNTTRYAYDSKHNLISMADPKGNLAMEVTYDSLDRVITYKQYGDQVTYSYDPSNLKTTKTDSLGYRTVYTFNALGVTTNILYSDGSQESFVYDENLNITSFTDGRGYTTIYTYDANGNLTSVTDPLGNTTTYTYEAVFNRLLTETDPGGMVTKYEYDTSGNLTNKYRAFGTTVQIVESYTYDTNGRKLSYTDPNGNTTTYGYDTFDNLSTITDPYSNVIEINTYDTLGNRITKTDFFGNVTHYQYDALGRTISVTDAQGYSTSSVYDENGNLVSETEGNGNTTTYEYNAFNKMIKVTDPLGKITERTYEVRGNVKKLKDPVGNIRYFQYNDRGNLIKQIAKIGDTSETPDSNDLVTTYTYDFSGNRTSIIDAGGNTTTFTYDPLKRITSKILPTGEAVTFTYDAAGNLINQTSGAGLSLGYEYDNLNRAKRIYDTLGTIRTFTYDGLGKILTRTDALGNVMTFQYDRRGKMSKRTYPDGAFDTTTYDEGGRLTSVTDRGGSTVTFSYDALNRITSSTDALGNTITATYDAFRKLTLTDSNGSTTTYQYDGNNKILKETYADSSFTAYTYDANGRMASRTNANGNTIYFQYDERGLLTKRDYPDTDDDVFTYGPRGELLTAGNQAAIVTRTYDASGKLLSEAINGQTVSYSYDTTNLIRTITYPGGRVIKEVFDGRERPVNIKDAAGSDIFAFQYNGFNKRTSMSYANGASAQHTYNSLNLVSDLSYNAANTSFVDYNIQRNSQGRLQFITDNNTPALSELYQYDAVDRLTSFKRGTISLGDIPSPTSEISYAFDAMNNWTSVTVDGTPQTRTVDSLNAYLTVGTATLIHDSSGNLTDDGIHTYWYDYMSRLKRVELKADNSLVAEFSYDALGRLVSRTVGSTTTTFHYDFRFRVIEEQVGGATSATYIFGPEQDEILQMVRGVETYFFHSDTRGNVLAATDSTGNVVERYQYDPYGRVSIFDALGLPLAKSSIDNPFFFKGKMYNSETGLYYFRARFYSPDLGRFITRDPAGFQDGLNLYEYALSDPINFDDLFGFEAKPTESCSVSGSIEFDLGQLAKVTRVVRAFGADFNVGGGISVKASACEAKCCKKQITYLKWELEANLKMSFEGVIPGLGVSVPAVGKFGLIGSVEFGIKGSGTLSQTFDKDCNVTCASKVCVGVYGQVSLMLGVKAAEAGDDPQVNDPFGAQVGVKGSMGASGMVCYGCSGWEFQACVQGGFELIAQVKVFWVTVGGSAEIWSGQTCTSNLEPT